MDCQNTLLEKAASLFEVNRTPIKAAKKYKSYKIVSFVTYDLLIKILLSDVAVMAVAEPQRNAIMKKISGLSGLGFQKN